MSIVFEPFQVDGELSGETFKAFLRHCTQRGASDILIQSGDYGWVEIHGRQIRATTGIIQQAHLPNLITSNWGADALMKVRGGHGADRSFQLSGVQDGLERGKSMRFRVNIVQARIARVDQGAALTMRTIPQELPDVREMGIEDELLEEFFPAKGLILVCGPTGSGKTTLQAGVYRMAGETMPDRKVITYEDPIEFVLGGQHWKGPQPAQSEIGRDMNSFADGLRNAMRRKPSIVGIGEIRDLETCDAAIEVGLTGHLCYGTMHTDSCAETINRAIQIYPPAQQASVASRLLGALRVMVVQRLLKTTDGKRVAVREFLIMDRNVRNDMRDIPYEKWSGYIQGTLESRQATLDDKAWRLLEAGRIDKQEFVELAGAKAYHDRLKAFAESQRPHLA
jgi:defect-in-organelle-trafficking protein DotB